MLTAWKSSFTVQQHKDDSVKTEWKDSVWHQRVISDMAECAGDVSIKYIKKKTAILFVLHKQHQQVSWPPSVVKQTFIRTHTSWCSISTTHTKVRIHALESMVPDVTQVLC